ncbi:MAG: hypothetical protein CVV03_02705 [Firmicutes bacterium HGW-Firmicutes-8]|nr:MAG: hypothetical protein CVV03_02705 [Firmicutes bacterium HGW-Firmicutes-8]
MVTLRNTASEFAQYLGRELNFDQKDAETVRYGIEIILGAFIKGLFIIVISYWIGIIPYVLAVFATSSILRLLSGGVHCSTYGRCLVLGTAMMVLTGWASLIISPYVRKDLMLLLIMLTALTGLYFVKKYAPADNCNKSITKEAKRVRYKRLSLFFVITWTVVIAFVIIICWESPSTYSLVLASIGGFLGQIFSLCPAGYRLIGSIDNVLGKILP